MWYKNVRAQNILIFLLSLTGLGATFYFVNLSPQMTLEERHQIEVIVFSDAMKYVTDHPDDDPDYFFLSVSDRDPSPRVLNEFSEMTPVTAPLTSSDMTYGFSSKVVHVSDSDSWGVIIDIEVMDKQSNGYVRVLADLYQARGYTATHEYILNKKDGRYRILSVKGSEKLD